MEANEPYDLQASHRFYIIARTGLDDLHATGSRELY